MYKQAIACLLSLNHKTGKLLRQLCLNFARPPNPSLHTPRPNHTLMGTFQTSGSPIFSFAEQKKTRCHFAGTQCAVGVARKLLLANFDNNNVDNVVPNKASLCTRLFAALVACVRVRQSVRSDTQRSLLHLLCVCEIGRGQAVQS